MRESASLSIPLPNRPLDGQGHGNIPRDYAEFIQQYDRLIRQRLQAMQVRQQDMDDYVQEFLAHVIRKDVIKRTTQSEHPGANDRKSFTQYVMMMLHNWAVNEFRQSRRRALATAMATSKRQILDREDAVTIFTDPMPSVFDRVALREELQSVVSRAEELAKHFRSGKRFLAVLERVAFGCSREEITADLKLTPAQVRYICNVVLP